MQRVNDRFVGYGLGEGNVDGSARAQALVEFIQNLLVRAFLDA